MKCELTHSDHSGRLILIFAGWGTDPSFYKHIFVEGYDTMVVYGYDNFDFPSGVLEGYHSIIIIAWSLGIFAAENANIPVERVAMAIAVNGTSIPVSDKYGIPEVIYTGTLETLSERNLLKFRKRMSGEYFQVIKDKFPESDIEVLKKELTLIKGLQSKSKSTIKWDRAYISEKDTIFPSANQINAWQSHLSNPEIIMLDLPHYVDLLNVVKGIVPSHQSIGEKFHKALSSYDSKASAQREIAERLCDAIPLQKYHKVIEIGPGSGMFTRIFCTKFQPNQIDFVDLYKLPIFNVATVERYHIADAEDWMENEADSNPESYDAIVSASAMQWFINPKRFIKNCHRLLKPGGILACSTFSRGNLKELDDINPYHLIYRTEDSIKNMIDEFFGRNKFISDKITLTFSSQRDTLMHLHQTGVAGSSSSPVSLRQLLNTTPLSLTFTPLFIITSK